MKEIVCAALYSLTLIAIVFTAVGYIIWMLYNILHSRATPLHWLAFYRVCEKEMNLKRVAGAGIKSLSQTNWFLHLNISGNSCDSCFKPVSKLKPFHDENQNCWAVSQNTNQGCGARMRRGWRVGGGGGGWARHVVHSLPCRLVFVYVQRGMNVSLPRLHMRPSSPSSAAVKLLGLQLKCKCAV